MASSGNGDRRFELKISGAIAGSPRQLQRQASREGRGEAFLSALRAAVESLRLRATELGEPLYRLPALRMQIRVVVIGPLVIDCAVCEDWPLVFFKSVKLLWLTRFPQPDPFLQPKDTTAILT